MSMDPGQTGAPARGKRKLPLLLAALALVGGGGFYAKTSMMPTDYRPGQKVPNGQILTLDPVTVNLADGHLVQVAVALQLTAAADVKVLTANTPRFLDAENSVFGDQTQARLLAPGGRDAVRASLLRRFRTIAGRHRGADQVSAVYLTSFVSQ